MSAIPCVVVHYDEIALKGRNRAWFEKTLERNLRGRSGASPKSRRLPGRILLYPADGDALRLALDVSVIPGVSSCSPALETAMDWDAAEATAVDLMKQAPFRTFAVRASRQDKLLPFQSREAAGRLGAHVQQATGAAVDLEHPDRTLYAEFLSKQVLLYCDRIEGPGGLPAGSAGEALCLLSGGIDSPAAAWMLMKRGCRVHFVHFHSFPFTRDRRSIEKCERIVERLNAIQGPARLTNLGIGPQQQEIATKAPGAYRILLYRRLMLKAAEGVADREKIPALVTGDSLGQVASQTLDNLAAVGAGLTFPILRPLVGLNKREIVAIAKRIGTYEQSIETQEDCCRFLEPQQVETRANPRKLLAIEQEIGMDRLVTDVLGASTEQVPLPSPGSPHRG